MDDPLGGGLIRMVRHGPPSDATAAVRKRKRQALQDALLLSL